MPDNKFIAEKQSNLQCRLKWAHSTVYLTTNTTASCHRCDHNPILENFDFHNTHQKVHARLQMLRDEWPELGCEHCREIEQAGGLSDRTLHDRSSFLPHSPIELKTNPKEVYVTPTELEIYFSNNCQLSCTYCGSHFSSTWEAEDKKYGKIDCFMRGIPDWDGRFHELKYLDKMFDWLDSNLHNLKMLYILGGEPFIQPQSDRLIDLLETKTLPDLNLFFFSNLSSDRVKKRADRLDNLVKQGKIGKVTVVGSIDCWNKQAEYIRYGLNIETFADNFEHILKNTSIIGSINMCWTNLSSFTMPDLIEKYNEWTDLQKYKESQIVINLMQVGGKEWLHPSVFGPKVLDWGYSKAIRLIKNTDSQVIKDALDYFYGIEKKIQQSKPDKELQKQLHKYLTELDRRRGTDYRELFPIIYEEIHKQ